MHELQRTIGRGKPARQTREQYDMSVTVMDISTGQVLATPFYTSLFDFDHYPESMKMTVRNTSLSRRSVGSVFKPLVALPAVLSNPNLFGVDLKDAGLDGKVEGMFRELIAGKGAVRETLVKYLD